MAITIEQVLDPVRHGSQEALPVNEVIVDRGPLRLRLLTLGAAIRSLEVPDSSGQRGHVHLQLPEAADYADAAHNPHLGATIGRYANRIEGARVTLDGTEHLLDANRPPNILHGGTWGFDRLVWTVVEAVSPSSSPTPPGEPDRVTMRLHSPDGDMGFPGAMVAETTYEVSDTSVTLHYRARCDRATAVSLTNHGYWNLSGEPTVADHVLTVAAGRVLARAADGLPTGDLDDVSGTPLDLRSPTRVGTAVEAVPGGLDHCYVVDGANLRGPDPSALRPAALLVGGTRWMSVATDCPGIQVYSANTLGAPFGPHASLSLEAQRLPDAPHHDGFGPWMLPAGDEYRSTTRLTFGVGEPTAPTAW